MGSNFNKAAGYRNSAILEKDFAVSINFVKYFFIGIPQGDCFVIVVFSNSGNPIHGGREAIQWPETYLEPSRTFTMGLFSKIVNG